MITPKPTHSPTPWKKVGPEKCGCTITFDSEYAIDNIRIKYCPLHSCAGELLSALIEVVDGIPRFNKEEFYRDLIAKAERKETERT